MKLRRPALADSKFSTFCRCFTSQDSQMQGALWTRAVSCPVPSRTHWFSSCSWTPSWAPRLALSSAPDLDVPSAGLFPLSYSEIHMSQAEVSNPWWRAGNLSDFSLGAILCAHLFFILPPSFSLSVFAETMQFQAQFQCSTDMSIDPRSVFLKLGTSDILDDSLL